MPFTLALASKWACAGGGGLALWCWWVVGTVVQRKGGLWLCSKEGYPLVCSPRHERCRRP